MKINTRHFGELEIQEEGIFTFPDGIPGFQDVKKYVIIQNPDEGVPFHWLQALEEPDPAFVIVNPFLFRRDYEFQLSEVVQEKLVIQSPEDLLIYTIVVVPEDINQMTANLAAPLVFNTASKLAKQVLIENGSYGTKHLILEEMKKAAQAG